MPPSHGSDSNRFVSSTQITPIVPSSAYYTWAIGDTPSQKQKPVRCVSSLQLHSLKLTAKKPLKISRIPKGFQGGEAVSYAHDLQSKALPQRSRLKKDLTDKIAENVNGKVGGKTVGNDVEEVGSEGYFYRGWEGKSGCQTCCFGHIQIQNLGTLFTISTQQEPRKFS